jgi:hypothetical protein
MRLLRNFPLQPGGHIFYHSLFLVRLLYRSTSLVLSAESRSGREKEAEDDAVFIPKVLGIAKFETSLDGVKAASRMMVILMIIAKQQMNSIELCKVVLRYT